MLTPDQKDKLRQAGYNDSKIADYERVKFGTQSTKSELSSGLESSLNQRKSNVVDTWKSSDRLGSKVLQTVGQGAGFIGDVGFEATKAITPEPLRQKISSGVQQVAQTKPAQLFGSVIDKAGQTEVGRNTGALINIAGLVPAGKGVQLGAKVAGKGLEATKNIAKGAVSKVIKKETSVDKALRAITPDTKDLTPTEYEDYLRKGKITPKTTREPSSYILSDSEKQSALKYSHLLQDNDPVKNSIRVMEDIANKDQKVGDFLKKNNGIYSNGELKNSLMERLNDITDITVDEVRLNKLKTTLVEGFIKALPKNDMETLWKARKAFDRSIEKVFSGSHTLQNSVKKEFRNAIQDFISDRTPEGVYKNSMKEMSELFNMHDTISTKAIKERGRNAIEVWRKNNPNKAKIIGWGSAAIAGGGVINSLLD